MGQDSAIARYLNEKGNNLEYQRKVVTTGLLVQIIPFLLFIIGFVSFSKEFAKILLSSQPTVVENYTLAMMSVPGAVLYLFSVNLFKSMFIYVFM